MLAYFCYPETKGLSIEEAFTLFQDDFGVKKSKQMRKEKALMMKNYKDEGNHWVNATPPSEMNDKSVETPVHTETVKMG